MGRMHSKGKGISKSALPYSRTPPSWLKTSPEEVVQQIVKLARKGVTPSQIGAQLRDSQGIAQVRYVTGNKILRILRSEGLAPEIPEDLYHLIVRTYPVVSTNSSQKRAVSVRKHLERNRKDADSKFRLILIESRIHRLSRYYKTTGAVPPSFKYESSTASTLVASFDDSLRKTIVLGRHCILSDVAKVVRMCDIALGQMLHIVGSCVQT